MFLCVFLQGSIRFAEDWIIEDSEQLFSIQFFSQVMDIWLLFLPPFPEGKACSFSI